MNMSISYPTSSNYHLLSDLHNNSGTVGGDSVDIIDSHGTNSASHSGCSVTSSSSVHLPLVGVSVGMIVDSISAGKGRERREYDNVRRSFQFF